LLTVFLLLFIAWASGDGASPLERGLVALQHGRLTEARQEFEQASRVDPQNAYVWSSLAETYLRLKLPELASNAAKTAEKTGAKDPLVCHALAMFYSESAQPGVAAEWEQRFAESPKGDDDALARSASLYLEAGEAQRAVMVAQEAISKKSSAAKEDLLGRALLGAGRKAEGEKYLSAAWEQSKTDPVISFDFAQVLLRSENFTRAAEVIDAALAAHPEDSQLTLALGVARYGQRRFDEALTAFLQVIKLDPAVQQPYTFIGRMLEQAGPHLAEIIKAYETWAAQYPGNAKAQLLLAKALLVQDHSSGRAESLLRRSIALDHTDWEARYELGALLENKHDYRGASIELMRSIELNPKEPMPHYHLARVYDRLGEPDRAEAERQLHQRLTAPKAP
jgi:Flp pilus assembly protein TadD